MIFRVCLYFLIVFFMMSCGFFGNPKENSDEAAVDTSLVDKATKEVVVEKDTLGNGDDYSLMTIPQKLDKESERYVDDLGHLHIEIVEAAIPKNQELEIIEKLFPSGVVSEAVAEKAYTAYNVRKEHEHYNIVVFYQNIKDVRIMSHIVVSEGEFTMELLEELFA